MGHGCFTSIPSRNWLKLELIIQKNYIQEHQIKNMTELIVTCTKCHKFMEQTTDNTIYWLCPNCGISIGITVKTDD